MIPRSLFDELKDKRIRIFVKDLPDPHCVQTGKIETVTEHLIVLYDEKHDIHIYLPIEEISLIRTI